MSGLFEAAHEKFEAAWLIYGAEFERADEAHREVQAALGPRPERTWAADETRAAVAKYEWYSAQHQRQVAARLGTDLDEYINPYRDRMESAERDLSEIEATSPDDLLCQLRAWLTVNECIVDKDSSEGRIIMRLLRNLERLTGEARS